MREKTEKLNKKKIYVFIYLLKALTNWLSFYLLVVSLIIGLAIIGAVSLGKKVVIGFLKLFL